MYYIYNEGGVPLVTCEKQPILELLDVTPSYAEAIIIAKDWASEELGVRFDWDSIRRFQSNNS